MIIIIFFLNAYIYMENEVFHIPNDHLSSDFDPYGVARNRELSLDTPECSSSLASHSNTKTSSRLWIIFSAFSHAVCCSYGRLAKNSYAVFSEWECVKF